MAERSLLVQLLLEERRKRLDFSPRHLSFSRHQDSERTISAPSTFERPDEACRHCGGDVLLDSAFCRHCGQQQERPEVLAFDSEASRASKGQATPRGFQERVREWSQQHQMSLRKQDLARRKQEARLKEQCTFQPAINGKSELFARRARGCYAEALPQRLYNDAQRRSTLRNKAKELLDAEDLYQCTFTPQINHRSDNGRVPLHLRTKAIQQMKQDRLKASQEEQQQSQQGSFRPCISARSQRLAQNRRRQDRSRSLDSRRAASAEPCTRPRLCEAPPAFIARQESFEKEKQFRMQVRRQHALADCTFQPRISASSEQLTSCNAELIGETPEERIQRLAVKDVSRRRLEQQKLQEALYRECTFQPALSPNSETIASARRASSPSRGVHLRLYEEGVEKERAKAIPLAQECSFKPQLDPRASKRFAHVKPHYSSPDDISDSIRQQQERKAEQLLERHAERERAEVAGCTFRPELREVLDSQPVVVSGLGRFFELRSLAQRQQEEQLQRESKVFHREAKVPTGITIPEPFALSSGNRSARSMSEMSWC
ncbi:unnamed protein product [Effrenium voratum]|uniref:Uncharacterized protein n=1 Tax=Effrenium voratum TaxID=2562239 RepID=A0AA36HSM7_9DINO|nr:unnamed protein product [Effrenium voratum]CAJ1448884.1 unnamed protein product [Effrenium voratum]CAJ1461570.1 unnamed protein product [Effrenium voratum]